MSSARTKTKRKKEKRAAAATTSAFASSPPLLENVDASLLDIVDHVLTKGIVLTGDLLLGVADIDLVYLRLSAVLCAADRILGKSPDSDNRRARHTQRMGPTGRKGLIASRFGSAIGKKKKSR